MLKSRKVQTDQARIRASFGPLTTPTTVSSLAFVNMDSCHVKNVKSGLLMGFARDHCWTFPQLSYLVLTVVTINTCLYHQIANHSGYVQVDWKKVEKDVNKAKKRLKKKANKAAPEISTLIEEVKVSVKKFALFSSLFSIIT